MQKFRWSLPIAIALAAMLYLLYPRPDRGQDHGGRKVTEITFLGTPGAVARDAVQAAIDEFERRNPQYRVHQALNTTVDMTGDPTRFLISLAGGSPPDVIHFDRFAVTEWAARGAFTPLDPYMEKDKAAGVENAIKSDDYYVPAWREAQWAGTTYGIPNSLDTRALFYNEDLLVKAGLVDAEGKAKPPRTWEELQDYAVKLTERDERGNLKVVGFAPSYGNSYLYIYGWMNGGEFMSADGRHATLTDPKIVSALEWMDRVYDKLGGFPQVNAFEQGFQGDALDPFITGKVAMKIDGHWILPRMTAYGKNVRYGIAPPPMPEAELAKGHTPVTWVGGWVYAIPSTAVHKEAAWELIRWMSSREACKIIGDKTKLIEASKGHLFVPPQHPNIAINRMYYEDYVANAPVDEDFKAGYRLFDDLIPTARYRPITPIGQYMWRAIGSATESAFYKQETPQAALERAQAGVQRHLDDFYKADTSMPMNWKWVFAAYALLVVAGIWIVPKLDRRFRERDDETRRTWRLERTAGLLFASPWLIGFLTVTAGAMFFSFVLSFCRYDLINPARWVGFENYYSMIVRDEIFWKSLGNTLFMAMGVPLGMSLSLGMAILLTQEVRGTAVWRTLFYLPSIVPLVASSILWIWIFNPQAGLLNSVLDLLGIHGPNWLGSKETSKISLILMGLWTAGGGMIIWIAGLKSIPESYYEAAAIDGANAWNRFLHVTLPMLTPYIFFNLIMGIIGTLKIFEIAYIMTNGGPVNSTTFYVYHLFNQAFKFMNMGQASAMAWILFALVAALTIYQLRLSKRWVHYDQG